MVKLTRTERVSLAVAEAVVGLHLGTEGGCLPESAEIGHANSNDYTVTLKTHVLYQRRAEKFVVEVRHRLDADDFLEARLYSRGALLGEYFWEFKFDHSLHVHKDE